MNIGVDWQHSHCHFCVWAPHADALQVVLEKAAQPVVSMEKDDSGYWRVDVEGIEAGVAYKYCINEDRVWPDPASHYQPLGVHGPSQVINHHAFKWQDADWKGMALEDMIIYELHIGTGSDEGTFAGVMQRLDHLTDLGINAIEIMPVAQFPGTRNWGYDGAYPFAVQNSYGGPDGLKKLVNACHQRGIAVILDVVYNHLGPEGNYLSQFGPYFTDAYQTPWGLAVNFDDAYSYGVRHYFIQNVLFWLKTYHIDALRLDAIHSIYDFGAKHILQEMIEQVALYREDSGRKCFLITESDLNDVRLINHPSCGGYGIDAQWSDDFHHAMHAYLTEEPRGYYMDFGDKEDIAKSLQQAFVYDWQYSRYRRRFHGSRPERNPAKCFVIALQNHDQVGNRMLGERLTRLVPFESLKTASAMMLLSPYVPLLFMGEEYGEDNPFLYFIDHTDPELVKAVREGRKEEFRGFQWAGEPPDPYAEDTFQKSKPDFRKLSRAPHKSLFAYYKKLIALRRALFGSAGLKPPHELLQIDLPQDEGILIMTRSSVRKENVMCLFNLDKRPHPVDIHSPHPWHLTLSSADPLWGGPGHTLPGSIDSPMTLTVPAESVAVYTSGETYE